MRDIHNSQIELGKVRIEDIKLDRKSRNDIPVLLLSIQYLYKNETFRLRLFELMDEHIFHGINKKVGRPGIGMWQIFVLGIIKQGLGCSFDHLCELANEHNTLRKFLGHSDIWDRHQYNYQSVADNVNLLSPELLVAVNDLVVQSGHTVVGKKCGESLHGWYNSFVVGTNAHYSTDVNLLWDAMRCMIRTTGQTATEYDVAGWRKWKHLMRSVQGLFHKVRSTRRTDLEPVEAYLKRCLYLVGRVEMTLSAFANNVKDSKIREIKRYIKHAKRQIDQVGRRLLHGEEIPQHEKIFSIFKPHTRLISKNNSKDNMRYSVELGVLVGILEDQYGFVLHHEVMWDGSDVVDYAVPMVESSQGRFADLRAVSFDSEFHSTENRIRLEERLDVNVLPEDDYPNNADQESEQGKEFVAMRPQYLAMESVIKNLERRGLDRVKARGDESFARMVALSVVSFNIHHIGLLLHDDDTLSDGDLSENNTNL